MEPVEDDKPLVLRDERGRVLPGSKLSAGVRNPAAATQLTLQRQFRETVGTERFAAAVDRLMEHVQTAGPRDAKPLFELLFQYYLGKPKEVVEMDITTNQNTVATTVNWSAEELGLLERMRSKIVGQADQAEDEVIDVTPTNGTL